MKVHWLLPLLLLIHPVVSVEKQQKEPAATGSVLKTHPFFGIYEDPEASIKDAPRKLPADEVPPGLPDSPPTLRALSASRDVMVQSPKRFIMPLEPRKQQFNWVDALFAEEEDDFQSPIGSAARQSEQDMSLLEGHSIDVDGLMKIPGTVGDDGSPFDSKGLNVQRVFVRKGLPVDKQIKWLEDRLVQRARSALYREGGLH